jgi:putative hydrolase of the HAD superfamily
VQHDAVLFDLFGTLVHTVSPDDYHAMLVRISAELYVPIGPFETAWRATIHARESGELGPLRSILHSTAMSAGVEPTPDAVQRGQDEWLRTAGRWLTPRVLAVETIGSFRDAGYKVGLISNCSAEIPPQWPANPLSELVDVPVFSCDVGVMKPDPAIYQRACAMLKVRPERCLFLGDGGSRELTGAAALGMEAVLLRVPGEEHTWFDNTYRQDALEWAGAIITDLADLTRFLQQTSWA